MKQWPRKFRSSPGPTANRASWSRSATTGRITGAPRSISSPRARSRWGKAGAPWLAAYCAAKFAAIGFTQCLAHELGEHGITVNAVCPGTVLTPLLDVPGGIFDVR